MQTAELIEDAFIAGSMLAVESNGEEQDAAGSSSGGRKSPGEVVPHLVADRGVEEGAATSKNVESLRDADSIASTSSVFEEVDEMRFRNTLLEVLEELKMRRQQDSETEESIGGLLDAKTTLEHLVEEGRRRREQLQEQLDRQEGEMRRSYELQLKELEAERVKASSAAGVEEREMKALKDEVKILQMERLGLERKLKESERKVQMLASSRESILSQTAQLGQKCAAVKKQLDEATLQLEGVEKSVHVAEERCQKLMYVNSHQECQLGQARRDLEQCRRRLLDAQVRSRGDPLHQGEGTGAVAAAAKGDTLKTTKKELKMEKELSGQLEQQLSELRRDHQRVVTALCKAHKLVDSHVDCNVRQTETLSELEGELEAVKGREGEARIQLSNTAADLEQLKGRVDKIDAGWQAKLTVAEDKLSVVQDELDSLRGRYQGLVEEHAQVMEAREALEQTAKGETSSVCDRLEGLRCELSEKQSLLEAKEREVEVERTSNQRRLLQLERAVDDKCKEVQSLKAALEDVTCSSSTVGQQRGEEAREKDEKGTQTEVESSTAVDDVLVGTGDSQPKTVRSGDASSGILSPLAVPAPPLSPDLIVSPVLQHGSSDSVEIQTPVEVTEVEGNVMSGDLPTCQSVECDTSKLPSEQFDQQDGGGSGTAAQNSSPPAKDTRDSTTALSATGVSPLSTHAKVPSKRSSPVQEEKGGDGVMSCKRVKQECEGYEEGEHGGVVVVSDRSGSGSGDGRSVQLGVPSATHELDFATQLCTTTWNKPAAVSSQGNSTCQPLLFASSQGDPTHQLLPLASSQGGPIHLPLPLASSQGGPTHQPLPLASSQGGPTHQPLPLASSQHNLEHLSHLPTTSQGSPAPRALPPTVGEGEKCTVLEYQKNQIILSDSDDDIITSSLAESISSVQKFLKRDRLKRSKVPLFKV